jgi:hypothetical protein
MSFLWIKACDLLPLGSCLQSQSPLLIEMPAYSVVLLE